MRQRSRAAEHGSWTKVWPRDLRRPMQLTTADFKLCYDEARPRIGYYGWMWTILRTYARGETFPATMYHRLQRFGNPRRPYFVGRTGSGIAFLGDFRDPRAAALAWEPDRDLPSLRFLE